MKKTLTLTKKKTAPKKKLILTKKPQANPRGRLA